MGEKVIRRRAGTLLWPWRGQWHEKSLSAVPMPLSFAKVRAWVRKSIDD
jgi:hypothetical protein